jgi:hypothetical protein
VAYVHAKIYDNRRERERDTHTHEQGDEHNGMRGIGHLFL